MRPPNPFSTRFTRPGALPPLAMDGSSIDAASLLRRLSALGGTAAIRGPHGSGKSTLMRSLEAALAAEGRLGGSLRLGGGRLHDPLAVIRGVAACGPAEVLCVDGWERLGPLAAAGLAATARLLGRQLLVTVHGATTIPTLVETATSVELLERIVGLLPPHGGSIHPQDVREAFAASAGDLREALFSLYDLYEAAGRSEAAEFRS